jgi:hypothetical protein
MKYIIILLTSLFLVSNASAGEIDKKGLVCGPVGYFFDHSIHTFYLERNGDLLQEEMGKYRTTPTRISVKNSNGDTFEIYRNNPQVTEGYTKYDCKLAIGYSSFIEMLKTNLENIRNNNKI